MEKDLIEQSVTRTYRASIWSRFIKALKEFNLLKENDSLILVLSVQKESILLSKLFQVLKKHSDFDFNIDFFCLKSDYDFLKENIDRLNVNINVLDDLSEINLINKKFINYITYDDVISFTLYNIIYNGEFKTHLPVFYKDDNIIINPLYFIKDKDIDLFFKFNKLESKDKIISEDIINTKKLIKDLLKQNEFIEKNIFKSIMNVNTDKILGYKIGNISEKFIQYYEKNKL